MRQTERFPLPARNADDFGLSCAPSGLTLAGVPLLRMTPTGFVPRPVDELAALMAGAYGDSCDLGKVAAGVNVVSAALNAGDLGRAMIAALHLSLSDLSWKSAARLARAESRLTKYDGSEPRDWRGRWTTDSAQRPASARKPARSAPSQVRTAPPEPARVALRSPVRVAAPKPVRGAPSSPVRTAPRGSARTAPSPSAHVAAPEPVGTVPTPRLPLIEREPPKSELNPPNLTPMQVASRLAIGEEVLGGGPEDPLADLAGAVTLGGGFLVSLILANRNRSSANGSGGGGRSSGQGRSRSRPWYDEECEEVMNRDMINCQIVKATRGSLKAKECRAVANKRYSECLIFGPKGILTQPYWGN